MSTISKLTLSSISIDNISSKIFLIESIFNGKLFKVASISLVVLKSSQIIEESNTPPFKIILSLYLLFSNLINACSKKTFDEDDVLSYCYL